MKKSVLLISLIVIIIFNCDVIKAQSDTFVPFLINQQSPLLYGAGDIGVSYPMRDPAGFYYNPALLGNYSSNYNLSIFYMPAAMNLYDGYGTKAISSSYGFSAGYNFNSNGNELPLSIGIGFIHNRMQYSYFVRQGPGSPIPPYFNNMHYSFNCFSIGASYNYYLNFNLGLSVKSFNTQINSQPSAQEQFPFGSELSGTAVDVGALITAPFDKLFFKNLKLDFGSINLFPVLKTSVGYSISNLGRNKYLVNYTPLDPIPRIARLGYTINFGLDTYIAGVKLPIIDYSFTAELADILDKKDSVGNLVYQNNLLGNINIGDNLLLLNGGYNVIVHKGHVFNFLKTLTIVFGRITGENSYNITTSGWAVSSEGIFNILADKFSSPVISYFLKHFAVDYYKSNISAGPFENPSPSGLSLDFKGI